MTNDAHLISCSTGASVTSTEWPMHGLPEAQAASRSLQGYQRHIKLRASMITTVTNLIYNMSASVSQLHQIKSYTT